MSASASVISQPVPRGLIVAARVRAWLPWLVSALTLVAAIHAIEPLPVGVFYDDAQYLVLAKSLASGQGYRFLNLPGAPAATHFPPGYPAFLAVLWRVSPAFPENVALFKFANAILLAVVALFAYRFAHRTLAMSSGLSAAAAVAGAATIPSLLLSSSIMSEPLFLVLLIPMLAWAEQETSNPSPTPSVRTPLFLGAAAGALTLVRTHGIALVAAIAVTYLVRRRRREALVSTAAALIVLAPWLVWVAAHSDALPPLVRGAYGSYFGWLVSGFREEGSRLLIVTVPDNVATIWMSIARSIVPDIHWSLDLLVGGAFLALAALGGVTSWRRARVMSLFIIFYFGIVLVWPFSPLRFVWGVWPLVTLFPALGIAAGWKIQQNLAQRGVLIVAAVVLSAGMIVFNARGYVNAWWSSNARYHARRVLPQLAWVARGTQPRDVIASDAEASVYLYTGRLSVPMTSFTAAEYVRERTMNEQTAIVSQLLDHYRPRYFMATSPPVIEAAARLARARPGTFVLIDSLKPGVVYEDRLARTLHQ